MIVCLYYGRQESRSTKKESENEFNQILTNTKNCIANNYVLMTRKAKKMVIELLARMVFF